MIKRLILLTSLTAVITLLISGSALAEAVYVKGNTALLADDELYAIDLSEGTRTEILTESGGSFGGATDVTVADCRAIVTTGGAGNKTVTVVSLVGTEGIPSGFCSSENETDACAATYFPSDGLLTMPCVDVAGSGDRYLVQMTQRGNSMNWEVTFVGGAGNE